MRCPLLQNPQGAHETEKLRVDMSQGTEALPHTRLHAPPLPPLPFDPRTPLPASACSATPGLASVMPAPPQSPGLRLESSQPHARVCLPGPLQVEATMWSKLHTVPEGVFSSNDSSSQILLVPATASSNPSRSSFVGSFVGVSLRESPASSLSCRSTPLTGAPSDARHPGTRCVREGGGADAADGALRWWRGASASGRLGRWKGLLVRAES